MSKKYTGIDPVIILPGINHSRVFVCDESGNVMTDSSGKEISGTILMANGEAARERMPVLLRNLTKAAVSRKSDGVYESAYELAAGAFPYQHSGPDGIPYSNLRVDRHSQPLSELDEAEKDWIYKMVPMQDLTAVCGEDKIYFFAFNLIGDPMESARELDEYIRRVKAERGCKKVTILPISLGGTILTAYIQQFGHGDVGRIVNAVACLDGTDIVADIFDKKFNPSREFFRHRFIPGLLAEETGNPAPGYAANILLRSLPDKALGEAVDGLLDGMRENILFTCPQFWAMVPTRRYESLRDKYITGAEFDKLREKTDAFHQAAVNLRENLKKAKKDGVKISMISGSNLGFGEVEYGFFEAVESYDKYNTDGVINLSSTTLGARGITKGGRPFDPSKPFVSPDGMIDASAALFPESTFIFMNQHHEIGKNSAALNLIKDIILGKVEDINSDPANYPEFNFSCNTYELRRWRINDAEKLLGRIDAGEIPASASDRERLIKSIEKGRYILSSSVIKHEDARAAKNEIEDLLIMFGSMKKKEEKKPAGKFAEKLLENISRKLSR